MFHLVCAAATPIVASSREYDAAFVAEQIPPGAGTLERCRRYLGWFGLSGLPPNRGFDPLRYIERNRPLASRVVHPLIAHILYGRSLGYDPAGSVWGAAGFAPRNTAIHAPLPLRIGVHVHVFHADLVPELAARVSWLPPGAAIFVTIAEDGTPKADSDLTALIARDLPGATVVPVPNRGRDIASFMMLLRDGAFRHLDLVVKIHSKKSPHLNPAPAAGAAWRRRMLFELLGSAAVVRAIVGRFAQTPDLGLIGAAGLRLPSSVLSARDVLQRNETTAVLAAKAGIAPLVVDFFAGSMFWARPRALEPLRALNLSVTDFPEEHGQLDGALHHAIERLFVSAAKSAGFRVEDTLDLAPTDRAIVGEHAVTLPEYLVFGDRALARRAG